MKELSEYQKELIGKWKHKIESIKDGTYQAKKLTPVFGEKFTETESIEYCNKKIEDIKKLRS